MPDIFAKQDEEKYHYTKLAIPTLSAKLMIKMITWCKIKRLKKVMTQDKKKDLSTIIDQLHIRHYVHNVLFGGLVSPRNLK